MLLSCLCVRIELQSAETFFICFFQPHKVRAQAEVRNARLRLVVALGDPVASMESIIKAAKLAGAHEFISELPGGYDTLVGEHGSTLSGGTP